MEMETDRHGDMLIVRVGAERIDAACAIQFKDRLREIGAVAPPRVVLDLSGVHFVDSSGLGAIVAAMKFLAPARRLELAALDANVAKVFRLTRMDSVFTIHGRVPGPGPAHAG